MRVLQPTPSPTRQRDPLAHPLIPATILLLALGLRLWRLGDANLWWDEALAIWAVRKGLLGVTLWTAGDVHPPLYFWSLWAWVQAVGESEFAMRSLSAAFGVLTVAVVYRLGRLVGGARVAALAAFLTAVARFHVWWSQEMRMYVLAGLAGTASLYYLLRWLRATREPAAPADGRAWRWLIPYGLCALAGLYTIFLSGALLVAQNLVVLAALLWPGTPRRGRMLGQWVLTQLVIGAGLAAWLLVSWGRMQSWSVAEPFGLGLYARLCATLLTTGISVHIERYTAALVPPFLILLGGALLFLSRWLRRGPRPAQPLLEGLALGLAVLLPAAMIYLATMPRSLFYTPHIEARYLVPFAPPFWLLLAASVEVLRRRVRWLGWAAGIALLALWIGFLPGHYSDRFRADQLQTMVRAIISQATPGDAVLLDSGDRYPVFQYYYDQGDPERPALYQMPSGGSKLDEEEAAQTLQPLTARHARFWLAEVDVTLHDPDRVVARWLGERYTPVLSLAFGPNTLTLYDPQGEPPAWQPARYRPEQALEVGMGQAGQLRGWDLPVRRYRGGDVAHVTLWWQSPPAEPVTLSLRSATGQLLTTCHAEPPPGGAPRRQQADLLIPPGAPRGQYTLTLADPQGAQHMLGTLQVAGADAWPQTEQPAHRVGTRFGEQVTLVGYSLRSDSARGLERLRPGDRLVLDLYWRAEATLAEDYVVFTHLLGTAHNPETQGPVWGQHDGLPAGGSLPTSRWVAGELVVDRHVLTVSPGAPAGAYQLEVGLYLPESGARLAARNAQGEAIGDRELLGGVAVSGR